MCFFLYILRSHTNCIVAYGHLRSQWFYRTLLRSHTPDSCYCKVLSHKFNHKHYFITSTSGLFIHPFERDLSETSNHELVPLCALEREANISITVNRTECYTWSNYNTRPNISSTSMNMSHFVDAGNQCKPRICIPKPCHYPATPLRDKPWDHLTPVWSHLGTTRKSILYELAVMASSTRHIAVNLTASSCIWKELTASATTSAKETYDVFMWRAYEALLLATWRVHKGWTGCEEARNMQMIYWRLKLFLLGSERLCR